MNKNLLKFVIAIAMMLLMLGCEKASTKEYFFQHPKELEAELDRCQQHHDDTSYCATIHEYSKEYDVLAAEQRNNPEEFGQRIMRSEEALAVAKMQLKQIKTSTRDPRKIAEAEAKYMNQLQQVKLLFAIIAGTSTPGAEA